MEGKAVAAARPVFTPPTALGVGCSYAPSLPGTVASVADLVDFVEISPDMLCREVEVDGRSSMRFLPNLLDAAVDATNGLAVVAHGLELSIGTAAGWNEAYLDVLDGFVARRDVAWHSEHLGFATAPVGEDGRLGQVGVPLPMPFTQEAVDLVAPRADLMVQRYGRCFLLENAAYYLPSLPADPGWDEIDLLNRLVDASACGLLLDLFNLYCNAVNHGFDIRAALDRLRLDRVVEVHIAGGREHDGFLLDSHSAPAPAEVWDLLAWLLPRLPNVAGVVFEVQEPALPDLGVECLRAELGALRRLWDAGR